MRFKLLIAPLLVLSSVVVPTASSAADWDYVYGDPGPADYSRYQAVELDQSGGAFLVGFFSGTFEGNTSPTSYSMFVQYRSSDGAAQWTRVLADRGITLPARPDLVVDPTGVAFVSSCVGGYSSSGCDDWTIDRSGAQLGTVHRNPGFSATPSVSAAGGFVRVSDRVLEQLSPTMTSNWTRPLTQLSTNPVSSPANTDSSSIKLSTDSDGGVWVAGDVPRPLPTQRDALALLHFDGDGNLVNSILHYGYSLGFSGMSSPAYQQGRSFVTANRDFFWINLGYDNVNYAPSYFHTVAFRVSDGALLGPVTGPVSPPYGPWCLVCGGYGLPYLFLPAPGVVGGGRRVVAPVNGFLEVHDLSGVTALTSKLVSKIPIIGAIDGDVIYDADDLGNIVIAGATTSNVVFGSTSAATESTTPAATTATMRPEASTSPRAFVTRNPGGRVPLKLTPNVPLEIKVTDLGGVPGTGVSAVALNVTVTQTEGPGFVTVYPCGDRKLVSSLNYTAGQTVPNAVIAPVSSSGTVCFFSMQPTHLLADVSGWFATGAAFTPVDPTRVFDTRPGEAALLDVVRLPVGGPGNILEVRFAGTAGVPSTGVSAVSLNVTVTEPTADGFLTVFPCGTRQVVSSVNFVAGQTVPNAVLAPLSPSGTVCFYSNVDAHVLADVNGWFVGGAGFTALDPNRLFDTRAGEPALTDVLRQPIGGSHVLEVQVAGAAGVPSVGVAAVSMNVTVDGPAADGFVTVFPCNQLAEVSSLNFVTGQTVANAVIAPLSPSGTVCFFANVDTDVLVDVNGWFATGGGFAAVNPNRLFDTR